MSITSVGFRAWPQLRAGLMRVKRELIELEKP